MKGRENRRGESERSDEDEGRKQRRVWVMNGVLSFPSHYARECWREGNQYQTVRSVNEDCSIQSSLLRGGALCFQDKGGAKGKWKGDSLSYLYFYFSLYLRSITAPLVEHP